MQKGKFYKKYMASDHFEALKARFKRDHCEICNSNDRLVMDHLSYEHLFKETEDDVCTLCSICHGLKFTLNQPDIKPLILGIRAKEAWAIFVKERIAAGNETIKNAQEYERLQNQLVELESKEKILVRKLESTGYYDTPGFAQINTRRIEIKKALAECAPVIWH